MPKRHFKMHLCDVDPVVEMIYEATAAPARAPFGRKSATSVHLHASEVKPQRPLSALSRITWNTAAIDGLNDLNACQEVLRATLADGRVLAADLRRAGQEASFAWTKLRRARLRIGAVTRREGFGAGSKYDWQQSNPPKREPASPVDSPPAP
jgi:hypothetical protein